VGSGFSAFSRMNPMHREDACRTRGHRGVAPLTASYLALLLRWLSASQGSLGKPT
jgi:hypothetical protein